MRVVLQRVISASVEVDGTVTGKIDQGLLILLGIEHNDSPKEIEWLVKKIAGLRIFSDEAGKMNLSVQEIKGGLLVVSQFTLFASTKKGNRPGFTRAAIPAVAIPLYEEFVSHLAATTQLQVETGIFGADMKVSLVNDGPVTIIIDTQILE
jgi:D-tyrosyl-tRNA(Tyr) deacylase